jgi:hypothetical protein
MSFSRSRSVAVAAALVAELLAVACGAASRSQQPLDVAGDYGLESVSGATVPTTGLGAILRGTLTLAPNGSATRRVTYQLSGVAPEKEFIARGTFAIAGDSILLALVEDAAHPERVWRPRAILESGELTLRYPHPADGPDIVEVFRRLP